MLTLLILVILLFSPGIVSAQYSAPKTEDMTKQSDLVVSGKVAGRISEWTPKHDRIQTRITLAVDQAMKGSAPGSAITIVVPGGEVDGVGEWYSHSVAFQENENVVVFAKRDNGNAYRVVGGEAGKISVKQDEKTGKKFIPNIGSLEEFSKNISRIATAQSGGQPKN